MLPEPLPARLTVNGSGIRAKVAVIDRASFMVTEQLPIPVHAPDQPTKRAPVAGVAVSVTVVSTLKLLEQTVPQEIPAWSEVTVPKPLPARLTVRVARTRAKVAVTDAVW